MPLMVSPVSPRSTAAAPALAPYARVKQHLKDGLAAGRWAPGALMPSEAELVARFGVSRMTVGRALRELQAEGLVQRTQGVGTFAAHEARVQLQRSEPAAAALAAQLGVAEGTAVAHVRLVHLENGVPLQCEDRYVNLAEAPAFLEADFTRRTPTHVLFESTALWRAQVTVEAARPTAEEARLLGVAADEPCLVVVRRTFSRRGPITLARLVHPGRRYSLQGEFEP